MDEKINEIKVVSINDFKKSKTETKKVILPESRLECTIKKVSPKEIYRKTGYSLISSLNQIKIETDRNKKVQDIKEISPENIEKAQIYNDTFLMIGCVYPKLTEQETDVDDEICIDYLSIEDYNFLVTEISIFSKGGEVEDLAQFRKE